MAASDYCGLFSAFPLSRKIRTTSSSRAVKVNGAATRRRYGGAGGGRVVMEMNLMSEPEYFQVGKLIGSYGFMNITSFSGGLQSPENYGQLDENNTSLLGSLKLQDVGEGNFKIRLYEGRVARGPLRSTPVIFKVYPGQQIGGVESDAMAANEFKAHASLQQGDTLSQNIQLLLGGFETKTGEQWLAFRNHGVYTAADYAKASSEKVSKFTNQSGVKNSYFWNPFERDLTLQRKRDFVIKLFQGTMRGLEYMHGNHRLHQSLGPYSVVLNTMSEKDARNLFPRLRDLAFSICARCPLLHDESNKFSQGIWRRATLAGANTSVEKRAFGVADDIYEAGLLYAYLALVPFCEAGTVDNLSLRRLLENGFQLDLEAARDYWLADDRMEEAVRFLDLNDGAGWELLQAMLRRDYRERPTAEDILKHRFFAPS